jgi:hypothetical protein
VRAARTWIVLVLAVAALGGCGSGDDDEPGLTDGQTRGLVAQLEAARTTASAGDLEGTRAALARFRSSVVRLRRSGALDDATARLLRIGAARVLERVESDNPPAATETTPAPEPSGKEEKDEKGHGKGKKKGKKD